MPSSIQTSALTRCSVCPGTCGTGSILGLSCCQPPGLWFLLVGGHGRWVTLDEWGWDTCKGCLASETPPTAHRASGREVSASFIHVLPETQTRSDRGLGPHRRLTFANLVDRGAHSRALLRQLYEIGFRSLVPERPSRADADVGRVVGMLHVDALVLPHAAEQQRPSTAPPRLSHITDTT